MIKKIHLPDLGEGIESAEVSEVVVGPGDTVTAEDTILVLESDKASKNLPKLNKLLVIVFNRHGN